MSISIPTAICLIACHGGPADHFATYAEVLTKKGYDVQIHATGPALKKFQEKNIEVKYPFSLDNLTADEEDVLAQTIAKTCASAELIITDLGHVFDIKLQNVLKESASQIPCYSYYDNPEILVKGGYSLVAAIVMGVSKGVWFANESLVNAKIFSDVDKEINLIGKNRFGIGYYPTNQADKIAEKRKGEHDNARAAFLTKNEIIDNGQKVVVYFGGNNDEYFQKAFPAFLSIVSKAAEHVDLKNVIIVIHQHPLAKVKNQDIEQVKTWLEENKDNENLPKIVTSDFHSDEAQVLADAACYYQTSMAPLFVLEDIRTAQIGHETYDDVLVRNKLVPSLTNAENFAQFIQTLDSNEEKLPKDDLLKGLGIKMDWADRLEAIVKESIKQK